MSSLIYNGTGVIPAPLVTLSRALSTDVNSNKFASTYNISLNGTIVATSGNGGMSYVVGQIKLIKDIFSQQGGILELISPDNASVFLKFVCNVTSIDVQESTWYDLAKYTVALTSNAEIGEDVYDANVIQATEDWDITEEINGTYSILHSLSAVGATTSGTIATYNAKNWCAANKVTLNNGSLTYLGSAYNIASGTISNPLMATSGYWNYGAVEKIGASDGSWQLQETLIWTSGASRSREEYTVAVNVENESANDGGTIQVQGTIFGFSDYNKNGPAKLENAKYDFENTIKNNLYTRASFYAPSGMNVSPVGTASSRTYDPINGTLAYSTTYPAMYGSIIPNAFNETIEVSDVGQNDVIAEISIPGRILGPIVQNIGTKTLANRTVSYSAQFPGSGTAGTQPISLSNIKDRYLLKPPQSLVNPLFSALAPVGAYYYVTQNTDSWNPKTFVYSKSMSWIIVSTGADYVGNIGSGVNNAQ